jgi:hypothetical protein
MKVKCEITYEENILGDEQTVNEWADAFERDLRLCLRGQHGYTGNISLNWNFEEE